MATQTREQRKTWRVTNTKTVSIQFVLEPWGDIIEMLPDKTYEVIAVGPDDGTLETEVSDDQITVYAWVGASLTVTSDGKEIWSRPSLSIP